MIVFYSHDIQGGRAEFSEEETRHCVQVLRKRQGDVIRFCDGRGMWYEGVISEVGKRTFAAEIIRSWPEEVSAPDLHLAVAPVKQLERFEWLLEKATEIGVRRITPLVCAHSERVRLRHDRLLRILLAAMKQSMRASMPLLDELIAFESFLDTLDGESQKFIAHCRQPALPHFFRKIIPLRPVVLLIGPEGDFSDAEIQQAEAAGFASVSLGRARLRTETAAVVGCELVNLKNELGN